MSDSSMSTTLDDTDTPTEDQSVAELAETVAAQTDDALVEQLATATRRLALHHSRLDDFARVLLADRLDDQREDLDDLTAEFADVQATVSELDQQVEAFIGPTGRKSGREKRLADIRGMMVRAAQGSDRDGVRWHHYDIEEQLASKGYSKAEIPSEPQLRDDMEYLAEHNEAFSVTTKAREGADNITRDVMALKVVAAELPANAESNQVTTDGAGGRYPSGGETAANTSETR